MPTFRVGDQVRCIMPGQQGNNLVLGQIYTVFSVQPVDESSLDDDDFGEEMITIAPDGAGRRFYSRRFELVLQDRAEVFLLLFLGRTRLKNVLSFSNQEEAETHYLYLMRRGYKVTKKKVTFNMNWEGPDDTRTT